VSAEPERGSSVLERAEPSHLPSRAERNERAERNDAAAARTQPQAPLTAADLAAARRRLPAEPTIERVLEAAARNEAEDSTDALATRARLSGLLPTLGLKARRGQAVDLTATGLDDGLRVGTDDDITLEAALRFELHKLLFAREEVPLARESRSVHEARERRAKDVIALYYERQRLLLEGELDKLGRLGGGASAGGKVAERRLERTLRIAELTALLDAFTGGAFSRMMIAARSHRL
jgi:hypothetical protein